VLALIPQRIHDRGARQGYGIVLDFIAQAPAIKNQQRCGFGSCHGRRYLVALAFASGTGMHRWKFDGKW
jgi:hypothetical protein